VIRQTTILLKTTISQKYICSHTRIAHDILNHAFELNSNFLTGKNIPLVGLELLFVFYGKKLGCELTYRNCLLSHLTHALLISGKHNLTGVMVTSQHVMLIYTVYSKFPSTIVLTWFVNHLVNFGKFATSNLM